MSQNKYTTTRSLTAMEVARDARSPLSRLMVKAQMIERINEDVLQVVGQEMAGRFSVTPPEAEVLVIVVAEAASGARIRLLAQEIAARASAYTDQPVRDVRIRVDPRLNAVQD